MNRKTDNYLVKGLELTLANDKDYWEYTKYCKIRKEYAVHRSTSEKLNSGLYEVLMATDKLLKFFDIAEKLILTEELVKIQSKIITLFKEGELKSIKLLRCLIDIINKMFKKIPKNSVKDFAFVSDLLFFANIQIDMLEKWSEE